uniref:ethanolamine kinase n=1 Tax=Strigamia maritima TaxID=126957 RepID=T1JEU3_STRMM
ASMKRYFEDSEHAKEYKRYRSELPNQIVQRIVTFLEEVFDLSDCVAVDVGCGSGQSTKPIGHILSKVIGIDISPEQIAAVGQDKPLNVEFKVGSYDKIPLPDNSMHLVTAVNAVHWFELDKFYQEANRLLVTKGVLALVRGTPVIEIKGCEEESQNLFLQLKENTKEYWDQSLLTHDYLYRTVNLPFRMRIRDESVITEDDVSISYVVNRVKTYSGIAKMLKQDPTKADKLIKEFESNLLKAVGRPGASPITTRVIYKRQFILLMGRKLNPRKALKTVQRIVECYSEVSVSGEGANIGPCGDVSLLQVGTCDGICFMFDLQSCPQLVSEGGLKILFETGDVIKIIHDCRALSAAFYCQFKIKFTNIFDTHASLCAHAVIQSQFNSTSAYDIPIVNLRYICARYSCGQNRAANFVRKHSKTMIDIDWTRRPFFNHTVCYAAARVMCLVPEIYDNMRSLICQNSWPLFERMIHLSIIYHIYPDEYEAETRRRVQRRYKEMLVVKQVEDCVNSTEENQSKNIQRLLGEIQNIKSKSTSIKSSFTNNRHSKGKAQSDNAGNRCPVVKDAKVSKSCGSRSTRTEVKQRRNSKAKDVAISRNKLGPVHYPKPVYYPKPEGCPKRHSLQKSCSGNKSYANKSCQGVRHNYGGNFNSPSISSSAKSRDSGRKVEGSEGKKTAKFGKGYVVSPDKCRSLVGTTSDRKILKRRSSNCEVEPKKKRQKTGRCDHHETHPDKDRMHVDAMKDWMNYLDLYKNIEETMNQKKEQEKAEMTCDCRPMDMSVSSYPVKTNEYLSAGSDKYRMDFCYDDSVPQKEDEDEDEDETVDGEVKATFMKKKSNNSNSCLCRSTMSLPKCGNFTRKKNIRNGGENLRRSGDQCASGKSGKSGKSRKNKQNEMRNCESNHRTRSAVTRRTSKSKNRTVDCDSDNYDKDQRRDTEETDSCDRNHNHNDDCDEDYDSDDVENDMCNFEETKQRLPCGVFNCEATSCTKMAPARKKTVLTDKEASKKCFKDQGHKCTCIDCWLLGAESESEAEQKLDRNNMRRCECGCSCLCSNAGCHCPGKSEDSKDSKDSTSTEETLRPTKGKKEKLSKAEIERRKAKTAAVDYERKFRKTNWSPSCGIYYINRARTLQLIYLQGFPALRASSAPSLGNGELETVPDDCRHLVVVLRTTEIMPVEVPHVNITVNRDSLEIDVKKILSVIRPEWPEDEIRFKSTGRSSDAGLLNVMLICYRSDDKKDAVMCRIYRDIKVAEFLNRQHETKIMKMINDLYGFAPNILTTFDNGFCYAYVLGEVMSETTVKIEDNWKLIAKQLALLHSTKPDDIIKHRGKLPDYFDSLLQKFPDSLPDPEDNKKFKKYLPSKEVLIKEYNLMKTRILEVGSEDVFCHGDIRPENMVWNPETGRITFVDWECCGMGGQAYEIAYHFIRFAGLDQMLYHLTPDKEFQLNWIRAYLENYFAVVKPNVMVKDVDVQKLYVQTRTYYLLLLLQGSGIISSLDLFDKMPINFLNISIAHYEEYKRLKEETLALKLPEYIKYCISVNMATKIPHLDITVNSDLLEDDLKKVLKVIRPGWCEKEILFKGTGHSADAGLLNLMVNCYRTDDMKDAVMCRIYREMKFNKFVTHEHESNVMQIVNDQYGFAPKVLATLNNGLCYEYVVGQVMTSKTVRLEDTWRLIAKQLAFLHTIKGVEHKSKLSDFFYSSIHSFPESLSNPEDNNKFQKSLPTKSVLLKEYDIVKSHALSVGSEYVFCHGDLKPENMVWNPDKSQITFVDWECCGMEWQAYEIAYHFLRYTGMENVDFSLSPDKEFVFEWLRTYLETYFSVVKPNVVVTDIDVQKLYVQMRAQYLLLLILIVGLVSSADQFDNTPLDFLNWSIIHYAEYLRLKDEILVEKLPDCDPKYNSLHFQSIKYCISVNMATKIPHLDITVNSDLLEDDLKKVLKVIRPGWCEKEILFKGTGRSADAGLLNLMVNCYRTDDKKDAVMCRIYREMKFTEFVTHEHESNVMQIVNDQYGFAPKVLATLNNGLCYEYVVGQVMTPKTVRLEDNWRLIAKQLALLHTIKGVEHKSKMADFLHSSIHSFPEFLPNPEANKKFQKSLPTKSVLLKEYDLVKSHALSVGSEYVFCHGDTRPENMVWNPDKSQITFVDWECCGMECQAYEIAYHFLRYAGVGNTDFSLFPDKEFVFEWLSTYLETYFSVVKPNVLVTDIDVQKLDVQMRAQYLLLLIQSVGVVSSVDQFDNIPFDFLNWSIIHYAEYLRLREEILALQLPE